MPKFFEPHQTTHHQEQHKPAHSSDGPKAVDDDRDFFTPKMREAAQIKTLLEWETLSRPHRPKSSSYYLTIAVIVILLIMIAVLAREFIVIATILSVMFVAYVLAFVPPGNVKYRISTQGITIGEQFYFWHDLDSFWFRERDGHTILVIQTYLNFPARLMLVLGEKTEDEAKKVVSYFLPFHETGPNTFMDRWSEKLQKHFPLENIHH